MERGLFGSCVTRSLSECCSLTLFWCRHVTPIDFPACGVGEVPEGGPQHQRERHDSAVRTYRGHNLFDPFGSMVETLVDVSHV